jgi:general secretion pathway protein D
MVFLRPTVIRTNEQSVNLSSDRYNYIRNAEIVAQPEPTAVMPNLGSPVLPELKGGRMVDGPLYNLRPANGAAPASAQSPQQPAQQAPQPAQKSSGQQ